MLVSLYTSRLVLQVLGEIDLGIYNLVGGIVTLMAFLQAAQTKATSRFITYELGAGGTSETVNKVFSSCMTIHILIGLVILLIAETAGLWIICNLTDIPQGRLLAANVVYQFSVITFILHFIRLPYDSIIIAHENMSVYAYMSILEVILKLIVVYVLMHIMADSLILYGVLLFGVGVILFSAYFIYVKYKFPQYRFQWTPDRELGKRILSLSGWTLLGSSTNTLTQQGVSLLLNNFVGLVANAAMGFANQVNSAVCGFINSFTTAFNPQVIKLYASKEYNSMYLLMGRASRVSFALCFLMCLPLIVNMKFILQIWLTNVPNYTVEFCQLILVCSIIDAISGVFNTAITATGEIKKYQIFISISFLMDLCFAGLLFIIGLNPILVFASRILTRGILNFAIGLHYSRKTLKFPVMSYIKNSLVPIIVTLGLCTLVVLSIPRSIGDVQYLFVSSFVSICVTACCSYYILLSRNERQKINAFINNKLSLK